ncbi:cytochrome c [Thioclava sp. F42-5]|uniref:c-type cytochrome n=1 Tax=Thioclava sp. F42-5 TaxID=1973005 RepID=UPI001982481F|nr:cytochrome c [Thioclava sp. F42-5]
MFTRKILLVSTLMVSASMAVAQTQSTERTSAELPKILDGKGERAPEPVPTSSAEDVANIAPDQFQFGIGRPATEEEIAAVNIDAMPDGRGLPEGSGTYAQGEEIYAQTCAACHGEDLGGIADVGAPRLIGGRGTLADDKPVKTVESYWPYASTLFDYVHRAMPMNAPGSLSADEVYAVSAYILGRAGITPDDAEASLDAQSLAEVEMPNANGFVPDPRDGSMGK